MPIPTEPIGSIPRPKELIDGVTACESGNISQAELKDLYHKAVRETVEQFEATGSPVISDGEQTKPSFATYPIHGSDQLDANGVVIPFADSHTRTLPVLTGGPFRYQTYASQYLKTAKKLTRVPVKQAVISASALSLLYPPNGLDGYSRDAFLEDLVRETETDIRNCLDAGAHNVQIDFTEGRLSVKLDPSRQLLTDFVNLNNRVLERFSAEQRARIGVHTCPGGDHDSTHSADVDYAELLPLLFQLKLGNFYIQLASEANRTNVLHTIKKYMKDYHKIFVGVVDPIDPRIETPEEVKERTLEAAEFIRVEQLGTTDDCGFSPFGDDESTGRDTAFSKIRARIAGTELAARFLGVN